MSLDPAYIRVRFPGVFDSVSDASLNGAIAAAQAQVNIPLLGTLATEASLYLACHIAELGKPGRASGMRRATAGQVTLEYGGFGQSSMDTSFLTLYKELIKRVVPPFMLGVAT